MNDAKATGSWFGAIKSTLQECRATFKAGGFRAVFRRYGWKIFAAFLAYYLIRDSILYLLIPYLVARHFID